MAKPIKCELWIGTSTRFFKWGNNFESIAAAKKYVRECITCYHEIRKVKPPATNKYLVEVNYQTWNGNPSTKMKVIEASTAEAAEEILHNKVKNYKSCLKIHGGTTSLMQ